MHHQDMLFLVKTALERGAIQHSQMSYDWDIAGDCMNPQDTTRWSVPNDGNRDYGWKPGKPQTLAIVLHTRCRKCENCLEQRRILWTGRALGEMRRSDRTWFGTFTLSADNQYLYGLHAERRATKRGYDWDAMTPGEQLVARHEAVQGELTKWFKRLRKRHAFRYLLVMEAHKSMLPHYHVLLHEIGDPIRKKELRKANWELGFTSWKVAEPSRAYYVAKYLSKSSLARVRASLHYGTPSCRIALSERQSVPSATSPSPTDARGDGGEDTSPPVGCRSN